MPIVRRPKPEKPAVRKLKVREDEPKVKLSGATPSSLVDAKEFQIRLSEIMLRYGWEGLTDRELAQLGMTREQWKAAFKVVLDENALLALQRLAAHGQELIEIFNIRPSELRNFREEPPTITM